MTKNNIRHVRVKRNINKQHLAKLAGMNTARLTAIETGATATTAELAKLADALDTPLDELLPEDQERWVAIESRRAYMKVQRNTREAASSEKDEQQLREQIQKRRREKERLDRTLRQIAADHESKLREHEELEDLLTKNRILRELNFPPEFHAAGITILQGFVKLIKHKYGDSRVGVTIKQTGRKVILIITAPDGKVEEIEEYLDRYTEVVRGDREITTLSEDPIAILELKGQLEIAKSQYQQQRDINLLLKNSHEQRILGLENQLEWFKNHLALSMESSRHVLTDVLSRLSDQDQHIAQLATRLVEAVSATKATSVISTSPQLAAPTGANPPTSPKAADKVIEELKREVVKEGVGKGLSDAIKKLIAWATTHLIG